MSIIDLTRTIEDKMSVYPGDDGVSITQNRFLNEHYFNSYRMNMGTHTGTHIDGPMHMMDTIKTIDEVGLEELIGRGKVIKCSEDQIRVDEQFNNIAENDIVLFYTGYEQYFGEEKYYYNHPVLTEEVIDTLMEKGVKVIGIDSPSIERDPYNLHPKWFKYGGYIVENLMNLNKLMESEQFNIFVIPLKIKGDSSPARVFANSYT